MKVEKITGNVGAEISGIDLSISDDAEVYAQIRAALNEHGVIFLRDQKLSLDQYMDFGARFGELFVNHGVGFDGHAKNPALETVIKEPHETTNIGEVWHTDQAHRQDPCMGTILYSETVPPYGGDTCFISTAAAWRDLPDQLKARVEGLKAIHSNEFMILNEIERTGDPDGRFRPKVGTAKASKVAIHDVVQVHPESGRKVLYVNPAMTYSFEGQTREESLPLLREIYDHCLKPEYLCRFRWTPNAIAFWDNRQVWHYAVNDYHGFRRVMYRLLVKSNGSQANSAPSAAA